MQFRNLIAAIATCALLSFASRAEDTQEQLYLGTKSSELILSKITVTNMRKSFDFYTKLIGLRLVDLPGPQASIDDPNHDTEFADVCLNFSGKSADPFLCLLKQKNVVPDQGYTKLTYIGVKTTDTRSTITRVKAAGYPVKFEATVFMGDVVGAVNDPDGYVVQIIQGPIVTSKRRK